MVEDLREVVGRRLRHGAQQQEKRRQSPPRRARSSTPRRIFQKRRFKSVPPVGDRLLETRDADQAPERRDADRPVEQHARPGSRAADRTRRPRGRRTRCRRCATGTPRARRRSDSGRCRASPGCRRSTGLSQQQPGEARPDELVVAGMWNRPSDPFRAEQQTARRRPRFRMIPIQHDDRVPRLPLAERRRLGHSVFIYSTMASLAEAGQIGAVAPAFVPGLGVAGARGVVAEERSARVPRRRSDSRP